MDKQTTLHRSKRLTAQVHAKGGSRRDVRTRLRAQATRASQPLSDADLLHLWQQLQDDPEAPEEFELTEHGEMVVSARASIRHQAITDVVAQQLREQLDGHVLRGVAVLTPFGVRVPDLVWLTPDRYAQTLSANPASPMEQCPPLVVEVVNSSSCAAAVAHRCAAFIASGAEEILLVSVAGEVHYQRADGLHLASCHGLEIRVASALLAH